MSFEPDFTDLFVAKAIERKKRSIGTSLLTRTYPVPAIYR